MRTHESAEMYLETILVLHERKGYVRSIDIANEMNFSKPSVSIAMKNLRASECIEVSPEGNITLTDKGREYLATLDAAWEELVGQIQVIRHGKPEN